MIVTRCDACGKYKDGVYDKYQLVWSKYGLRMNEKWHLCEDCFGKFLEFVNEDPKKVIKDD